MSNSEHPFPVPNPWVVANEFTNKDGTMSVRVTSCTLPEKFPGAIPLTHYTWELIRIHEKRSIRHFQIICEVSEGIVTVQDFLWDEFIELLREAQEWVRVQRQAREDALTERRAAKDKFNVQRGLKTLSKEDAKKKGY